ncbi:hypothetical protein ACPCKL_19015 [Streptomyces cellulosae]
MLRELDGLARPARLLHQVSHPSQGGRPAARAFQVGGRGLAGRLQDAE